MGSNALRWLIAALAALALAGRPADGRGDDRFHEFSVWAGIAFGPRILGLPHRSPALSMEWDRGRPSRSWFVGLDSAPLAGACIGGGDYRFCQMHLLALSGGAAFGGDAIRVGPYATVGLVQLGGGVRSVVQLGNRRSGALEGRLAVVAPGTWQAMLLLRLSRARSQRARPEDTAAMRGRVEAIGVPPG